jgi:hypothetical protein
MDMNGAEKGINCDNYLASTKLLDFENKHIQKLIKKRGWKELLEFERIKAIYNFVRDEILFGYNVDDDLPASKILRQGFGQCNTKGILFMALLRGCGIPCRIHGFTIDKKLQKGAMKGFVYKNAPKNIFHSWVEVQLDDNWYELEAFILDQEYLKKLQERNKDCEGPFCGYGVAVKDFQHPVIDFDRNNTYIQSEGITQDFGTYDSPDELLKEHGQEIKGAKKFLFRHLGRHLMNHNIKKIRKKDSKLKAFVKRKTAPAREFMREGRVGGMIAEMSLAALLNGWILSSMFFHKLPGFLCCLIAAIVLVLSAELLSLGLRLLFGAGKRCRTYFMTALFMIVFDNVVGTQANAIPATGIMSFLLVLAVNVTGRCAWAFVKSRRFKQVFAYAAVALSVIYMGFYAFFLTYERFGKSRIDFYNQISVPVTEQVKGFDAYLENGPHEVAFLAYGPEDSNDIVTNTLDFTVYDSVKERKGLTAVTDLFMDYDFGKVPVKGKVWYPKGMKNCPVFFMVHGNHESNVPSYLGYEYLGEYLASHGYVVVSVDENIINASGEGNDKRAILLLENMKSIFELNESSGNPLYGLMNEELLAIGGHSRGGEMVATAYLFNELDAYPEDGNIKFDYHFHVSSIVAIAPVVDQYRPVSHSVKISDVNYLLIHGANDQDVSSMMGEKQYNNITFSGNDNFYLKSSVYILGANHGQFNSLWGRYDSEGICNHYLNTNGFLDEADQKLIAKAYVRVFLDVTLGIDHTYESLLSDVSAYRDCLPKTVYLTNYTDTEFNSLCSFDDTTDISNGVSGAAIECTGVETWTISTYARGDGGEGENYVLDLTWEKESEPVVEVSCPAIDISDGCISFEIADMRENTEKLTEGLNYRVELTDASGNVVSVDQPVLVYHALAIQFGKQDALFGTYEYKHQLRQVTIEPSMFGSSEFDFTKVVSMKIVTDGNEEGELIINNIGYWKRTCKKW